MREPYGLRKIPTPHYSREPEKLESPYATARIVLNWDTMTVDIPAPRKPKEKP